jgi:hypothetical protein
MSESHCVTTEDGSPACAVDCACSSPNTAQESETDKPKQEFSFNLRSGISFAVACITSPCCTPIIVPLFFALIAGTPFAAIIAQYTGLIYGALTLVSIISLVVGIRWLSPRRKSNRAVINAQPQATPELIKLSTIQIRLDNK